MLWERVFIEDFQRNLCFLNGWILLAYFMIEKDIGYWWPSFRRKMRKK